MTFREKVDEIFGELTPERAKNLQAATPDAASRISGAMADVPEQVAHDIGFHLTDWARDAAFLVALVLYPERFSKQEVRDGVRQFVIHAPNHVFAAAKLAGEPVRNIFGVGALDESGGEHG